MRAVIVYNFRLKYFAAVSKMKVLPNSNCHLNKQRLPALAINKKAYCILVLLTAFSHPL